ncbi:4'-phosphopantetheinyl transferase superfamily protein [Streptomyces sp. 7-21]|uniref:4'-phosphopantetheinyl transferase family protein n=1 Tax=Streptomyces sp. 7-21 TaxID=2802283 RepID=UPI00191D4085|nr:4'-phosphopantetheinyl transferase superfamily protein [Streptomyces sp. 7-21]MBL1068560.1 4'-phosphopantetheinyl transferase superfamily protein [Streptomyces sp. 7-21]
MSGGEGLLAGLLPGLVAAREAFGDEAAEPFLFPEEERHVAKAVEKRRREFTTVRALARDALARLGGPRVPLLPGERGAPSWPDGFTGSMTHCLGYRGAAVARTDALASVGIDAEPDEPLPNEGLLEVISLPEERPALKELAARWPGVSWERLLFSAKESVYKAWFPLTRAWLDFEEAAVTLRPDDDADDDGGSGARTGNGRGPETGSFTARLLVPGPVVDGVRLSGFTGRWVARRGLLVTAIAVARAAPATTRP